MATWYEIQNGGFIDIGWFKTEAYYEHQKPAEFDDQQWLAYVKQQLEDFKHDKPDLIWRLVEITRTEREIA